MLDYAKAIKMRMIEKGLTYEKLEEISGYSGKTIWDIANGKNDNPHIFVIEVILESLGLKLAIMEDE